MLIVIGRQWQSRDYSDREAILTPFGDLLVGEIVEAPYEIAEYLIHNQLAQVARNWRQPGEKVAPTPIPTRVLVW